MLDDTLDTPGLFTYTDFLRQPYAGGLIPALCEGYSGIRIRTDDPYIRNVASGGALYIVWLYAALEL
jgi:hypothetical protein